VYTFLTILGVRYSTEGIREAISKTKSSFEEETLQQNIEEFGQWLLNSI
jgi:hypothetical protein